MIINYITGKYPYKGLNIAIILNKINNKLYASFKHRTIQYAKYLLSVKLCREISEREIIIFKDGNSNNIDIDNLDVELKSKYNDQQIYKNILETFIVDATIRNFTNNMFDFNNFVFIDPYSKLDENGFPVN
jgi:hypothetical protein